MDLGVIRRSKPDRIPVYPCRDLNCSLRVIPASKTREETYCVSCPYYVGGQRQIGCLFLPSYLTSHNQLYRIQRAQKQVRERNRELKRTCWNCHLIRQEGFNTYVCMEDSKMTPLKAYTMQRRAACERFDWRQNIKPLKLAR